jgi:hypothetical protein
MIKLEFDAKIGGYRGVNKPIYDSQDMIEKYISINKWRVKIIHKGQIGVSQPFNADFHFMEARDIYGKVVYISTCIKSILKSDYLDWSCPQLVELMSYWQW